LALELFDGASEELDVTVFAPNDATIENLCAQKIKEENAAGKFTDTAKFALLCTQCNTVLHGEQAATEHAMKTKHTKFVEKR
jgi:ubiquitin thioesterase OTU1